MLWIVLGAALAVLAVLVVLAVWSYRRRGERTAYLRAAGSLVEEELLNRELFGGSHLKPPASHWLMLYLKANTVHPPNRFVFLPGKNVLIGRSDDCGICIREAEISLKHCRIGVTQGRVFLEDLNSANGTYVKRRGRTRRLVPKGAFLLKSGDQIRLGTVVLKVTIFVYDNAD